MSIAKQEFTNAGRNMLGRANNGETLTFTRIVIGAGAAAVPSDLWPLTALIDHRFDVSILAQVDQGNGILILDGTINSASIPSGQGFDLRELGAMAHIGNEPDQLYSVANVLLVPPDYIPDEIENPTAVHAFKIKVVIDRASAVTVVIGTSTDILAENIGAETVGPGWFKEKIANTLRFKRAIEGTGIELDEDANNDTITIGVKTLKVSLDLFVPLTYVGMPAGGLAFVDIQSAWNYLGQYDIPIGVEARINVDAGHFPITEGMVFGHRNGRQISIIGRLLVNLPIVTLPTVWAVAGANNWQADVIVADGSMVEVDDVISWRGAARIEFNGAHQVTAKPTANTIRFLVSTPRTPSLGGLTAASTISWHSTQLVIEPAVGSNAAITVLNEGLNLQSIAILDTTQGRTQTTILVNRPPTLVNLIDVAICRGFVLLEVREAAVKVALLNCFLGDGEFTNVIIADGAKLDLDTVDISSSQGRGIWLVGNASSMNGINFVIGVCGGNGLTVDTSTAVIARTLDAAKNYGLINNGIGLYCHGGVFRSSNGGVIVTNTPQDVYAIAGGLCHFSDDGIPPNIGAGALVDPLRNTIRSITPGSADTALIMIMQATRHG